MKLQRNIVISLIVISCLALTVQYKDKILSSGQIFGGQVKTVTSHNNLLVGSSVASGSGSIYMVEFVNTGTVSLNFQGTSTNQGTCFQLQNAAGQPVYARVFGTTFTINTTRCHP